MAGLHWFSYVEQDFSLPTEDNTGRSLHYIFVLVWGTLVLGYRDFYLVFNKENRIFTLYCFYLTKEAKLSSNESELSKSLGFSLFNIMRCVQ